MPKHKPKLKQIQIKNDIKNSSNPKLKQTPAATQNKLIKQTQVAAHNYLQHTAHTYHWKFWNLNFKSLNR